MATPLHPQRVLGQMVPQQGLLPEALALLTPELGLEAGPVRLWRGQLSEGQPVQAAALERPPGIVVP